MYNHRPYVKAEYLSINNFIKDGFEKVCDVIELTNGKWYYENIDQNLMYSDHTSWVYFIVIDGDIVKCGETGNPLGIRKALKKDNCRKSDGTIIREAQPVAGTMSRFGRLANHSSSTSRSFDTDVVLRESISPFYKNGKTISLWARKCEIVESAPMMILGEMSTASTTIHKALEMEYLEFFKREANTLPLFNKSTK
jgi:hypothetical protein